MSRDGELIAAARRYTTLGWRVLPIHGFSPDSGCTCGDGCPDGSRGKHVRDAFPLASATSDPDRLAEAILALPLANIAVATGEASGIWGLDVDGVAGGSWLAARVAEHGPLPPGPVARTGNGRHVYFRWQPGIPSRTRVGGQKVDSASDGTILILPPSRHASGRGYAWAVAPWLVPPPPAPAWLVAFASGGG